VTRTICSGRCAVPVNKSVDSMLAIRICPSLHDPGEAVTPGATPSGYLLRPLGARRGQSAALAAPLAAARNRCRAVLPSASGTSRPALPRPNGGMFP
jgi:hypothetical protein